MLSPVVEPSQLSLNGRSRRESRRQSQLRMSGISIDMDMTLQVRAQLKAHRGPLKNVGFTFASRNCTGLVTLIFGIPTKSNLAKEVLRSHV